MQPLNRSLLLLMVLLLSANDLMAARALKRWFTHTQADGTVLSLRLEGDEHSHWFLTEEGVRMKRLEGGDFEAMTADEIKEAESLRRERLEAIAAKRKGAMTGGCGRAEAKPWKPVPTRVSSISSTDVKKGLVILMQFTDQAFRDDYAYDDWDAILNEEGYSYNGAPGSVADYFNEQSSGQFRIEFDVFGPFTASYGYAYYGQNNPRNSSDIDINVCYLVAEACDSVKGKTDFSQYDWDGDGEVDQVFILYAGEGENVSGNSEYLIWPHEYYLQYYSAYYQTGGYEVEDGIIINQYACGAEILWAGELSGLGTFCHEFSHCLGLPDFYTSEGIDSFGEYDVLGDGNYNNDGWCPPNYTAYEKMYCGWYTPIELSEPATIEGLETMANGGEAYMVRNDTDVEGADEYYLLENRQQTGWDAYIPGAGLIITHYDYDETAWLYNSINDDSSHPRAVIIPANNNYNTPKGYAYPYSGTLMFGKYVNTNDSLTDDSSPAAVVYNQPQTSIAAAQSKAPGGVIDDATSSSKTSAYYMGKPITEITHDDGLVGFKFMGGAEASGIDTAGAGDHSGSPLRGQEAIIRDASGRIVKRIKEFQGTESLGLSPGVYLINGIKVAL